MHFCRKMSRVAYTRFYGPYWPGCQDCPFLRYQRKNLLNFLLVCFWLIVCFWLLGCFWLIVMVNTTLGSFILCSETRARARGQILTNIWSNVDNSRGIFGQTRRKKNIFLRCLAQGELFPNPVVKALWQIFQCQTQYVFETKKIWYLEGAGGTLSCWQLTPRVLGVAHTPTRRGEENIYKAPTYSQHNEEAHVIKNKCGKIPSTKIDIDKAHRMKHVFIFQQNVKSSFQR